jgi:OOP family OmpA-OmpF porin
MSDKALLTPLNDGPETPAIQEPPDSCAQVIPDAEAIAVPSVPVPDTAARGDEADLEKLRELLFLREMKSLRKLENRLDDPVRHAQETSEVIAEALLLRGQKKDPLLYTAFEPMAEALFKEAMRKNPMDFVNALFPLMGPAIRRSIAETFRSMLEGFHKTMEQVFSWKGLRWRWQAWRTGVSFSEVVLLNTLLYRVEQIFFIHAETGLVLSHVSGSDVTAQDADMVSAMFTAIQDFARDCFAGGPGSNLDSLQLGEFTILLERGSSAYLACVVRGAVPLEFRGRLRDAMSVLQVKYANDLDSFTGDAGEFVSARWILEDLLDARYAGEGTPLPFWVRLMPAAAVLLLVLGGGYMGYSIYQRNIERHHMEESFAMVGERPGILLVEARQDRARHWRVIYQRDPFAEDPKFLLNGMGIDPKTYTLQVIPYLSYESEMITLRVKERIVPPEGVTVEFDGNGTLRLRGNASMAWMLQARQEALALPGVERIDMSGLTDPRIDELKNMIALVESTVVEFPLGKDTPVPDDASKLARAVDTLVKIEKLAAGMNIAVSLTIYGRADATGDDKRNYEISRARTRTVAAMLYTYGSKIPVSSYALGSMRTHDEETNADPHEPPPLRKGSEYFGDQARRRVELKVHLAQLASDTSMSSVLR